MPSTPTLVPMTREIDRALSAIEAQHRCRILFAVESGSRAWGCPSPDSDWDVRFVYAVPPRAVVTLWPDKDTIEQKCPGDLDMAGWRIDKAVKLLLNGNCSLREWLASPIVYWDIDWIRRLQELSAEIPARQAAFWHYRNLLLSIWDSYIEGEERFSLKRYLYVVRPALAMLWLEQHPAGTPPMDFPALLASVEFPAEARAELATLLARKALTSEIGEGGVIMPLHDLVAQALRLKPRGDRAETDERQRSMANALYRAGIAEAGVYLGSGWR